jgi:hypothetical protein
MLSRNFVLTDNRLNANAHVGTALAHHLQMELLRSHLRLSIADLQDSKILDRYYRVRTATIGAN